jgi:protein-disulfide isomerase/uncharacterized membrane protein
MSFMSERLKKTLPIFIFALIGVAIGIASEVVYSRLEADVNYASFCNVNAAVNCDVVLSSRYAALAGVSLSMWAILYYLFVIALAAAIILAASARLRERLATITLLVAAWGLLFSIYMAVIALGVLHAVCVMCGGLYLVSIGVFAAAWRSRSQLLAGSRRRAAERAGQDRLVVIGSIIVAALLIAFGSWEAFGPRVRGSDAAAIARELPDFYRWYLSQPIVHVPVDGGHSRGKAGAPVTIVEFSDFECGHCAQFHHNVDNVLRRYGPNVQVVFHHFPLDSDCNPSLAGHFHREACLAAVASECAAQEGQFWQYHDVLFNNHTRLGRQSLIEYAAKLGLDTTRFTACLDSPEPRARVQNDVTEATALGVDSTPTVFINGRLIKGALESDLLCAAVTLARAAPQSY